MTEALVEVRFYSAFPGRRSELAAYMDEVVIPFNTDRGVEVIASLVSNEDADTYIWIRRFDNEMERTRLYAAVYEDPKWILEIGPSVLELMDRDKAVVTRASPTPKSRLQ